MPNRKHHFSLDLQPGGVSEETTARLASHRNPNPQSGVGSGGGGGGSGSIAPPPKPGSTGTGGGGGGSGSFGSPGAKVEGWWGDLGRLSKSFFVGAPQNEEFKQHAGPEELIGKGIGSTALGTVDTGQMIGRGVNTLVTNPTAVWRTGEKIYEAASTEEGQSLLRHAGMEYLKAQVSPENLAASVGMFLATGGAGNILKGGSLLRGGKQLENIEGAVGKVGKVEKAFSKLDPGLERSVQRGMNRRRRITKAIPGMKEQEFSAVSRMRTRAGNRVRGESPGRVKSVLGDIVESPSLKPTSGPSLGTRQTMWRGRQVTKWQGRQAKVEALQSVHEIRRDPVGYAREELQQQLKEHPEIAAEALSVKQGGEIPGTDITVDDVQASLQKEADLAKTKAEGKLDEKKDEKDEPQQQRPEEAEEMAPTAFQFSGARAQYTAGRGMRVPSADPDPYVQEETQTVSTWPKFGKQPARRGSGRSPYRDISPETPFGEAMKRLGSGRRGLPGGSVWEGQTALGGIGLGHDWRTLDSMSVPRGSGEWDLAGKGLGRAALNSATDKFRNRNRSQQTPQNYSEYHGAGLGNVDMGSPGESVNTVPKNYSSFHGAGLGAVDMGSPIEKVTPVRPTGARTGALAKIHNELNVPSNPRFSETAAGRPQKP